MSWLDPKNDTDEKLRNLLLFKFCGTNKDMQNAAPIFLAMLVILIIILAVSLFFVR